MTNHPITGEWVPPTGFPRLPEPDGRELRATIAAAKLLGIVPPHMSTVAKREGLSIYTAKLRSGGTAHYFLLDELLELKARRSNFVPETAETAHPTEFKLKTDGS